MASNSTLIALFSWPLVVFFIFRLMPRGNAIISSILWGYLLLPTGVGIDFPLLPSFDKDFIPAFSAFVMVVMAGSRPASSCRRNDRIESELRSVTRGPGLRVSQRARSSEINGRLNSRNRKYKGRVSIIRIDIVIILVICILPFFTVMNNSESIIFVGGGYINGLNLYDAFSMALHVSVSIIPYLLARKYISSEFFHNQLLRLLCISGVIYSIFALFEIRFSPQLNYQVYGYFPSSYLQHVRGGGYRPLVFLQHGLWLAIFFAMTVLASFSIWRSLYKRGLWFIAGVWILGVLALSHSLGGLAIALILVPVVLFMGTRGQMIVATLVAFVFMLYPMLRSLDLVPVDTAVEIARSISPERAKSLEFRFRNEDMLLDRAGEKFLTGWGAWGRGRVYDEVSGDDLSVTDGIWVIIFGVSGWIGYISQFGLLALPIFALFTISRKTKLSLATSGLCVVLAANMIDMLLNGTLTPITWLIAGSLAGHVFSSVANPVELPNDARSQGSEERACVAS